MKIVFTLVALVLIICLCVIETNTPPQDRNCAAGWDKNPDWQEGEPVCFQRQY